MAKKKKNTKTKAGAVGKGQEHSESDDEGSMYNDAGSVTSEASTLAGEGAGQEEGVEGLSKAEQWEDKVREALELAGQKSAGTRLKGLEALCTGLTRRYAPDFVSTQQLTTCDLVERAVKKGRGGEVVAGARLAVLLALQLPDPETVYTELRPTLAGMAGDRTASLVSRAAAATSLAGLCFLGGGEMAEVVGVMGVLEGIFSTSRTGGDIPPDMAALHSAALEGWSLLLTLQSSGEVYRQADRMITLFRGVLGSSDVELRITAGEAIALVLEFAYDYDEEFMPAGMAELVEAVRQLATDSNKSRSKKDRKEQRSSFRDILRGVEEGDPPSVKVKFDKEVLYLDCWYKKLQYDWFCKVLASGMNLHLSTNMMLREIFELGTPLLDYDESLGSKPTKSQRNAANQQAFKMRTQSRMKNRDKRSAVL